MEQVPKNEDKELGIRNAERTMEVLNSAELEISSFLEKYEKEIIGNDIVGPQARLNARLRLLSLMMAKMDDFQKTNRVPDIYQLPFKDYISNIKLWND
jgi:hypothetical protein